MYKIKSNAGEVKELCSAFLRHRKEKIKKARVDYIHMHLNDKNFFGKRKYKSVKDVIRYMKTTGDFFGTIWYDFSVRGDYWSAKVKDLYDYCKYLPSTREVWLNEDMSFLFTYKD